MKKRYKINIDPAMPSKEEIAQHQNFEQLYQKYKAAPKGKVKFLNNGAKYLMAVAASVAVLITGYWMLRQEDTTYAPADEKFALQAEYSSFIEPPMQNTNVHYAAYKVPAQEGQQLEYFTGTKITIPENAFVDAQGNPVEGEVDIKYREFHDPVDLFLCGVPMTYDSAGQEYTFETAGMMEIQAFQNGMPVFLHPEKEIQIDMASAQAGDFNLYYLDTAEQNWVNKGKDKTTVENLAMQVSGAVLEEDTAASPFTPEEQTAPALPEQPKKPKAATPNRYRFTIDVDPKEFPEIMAYEGVQFEVAEGQQFNPDWYNILWEDVNLKKISENNYEVTFRKGETKKQFRVYPVFEGDDLEKAQKEYEQKYRQYLAQLNNRKAEEERKSAERKNRMEDMKRQQEELKKQWEEERRKWQEEQKKRFMAASTEQKITRSFAIDGFGYWNCDRPTGLPKGAKLMASFTDQQGEPLNVDKVYLVDRKQNSIFTYYSNKLDDFRFDPQSENLVWTVLDKDKIAVFRPQDFKAIDPKADKQTFKMKIINGNFQSVEDVKKILNFNS